MTPQKLTEKIEKFGFNQSSFARYFGITPRQVRRWIAGDAPIPTYIDKFFSVLKRCGGTAKDLEGLQ